MHIQVGKLSIKPLLGHSWVQFVTLDVVALSLALWTGAFIVAVQAKQSCLSQSNSLGQSWMGTVVLHSFAVRYLQYQNPWNIAMICYDIAIKTACYS